MIGAAVVLVYTLFGGMWSVAFTDLFQTVVIMLGLIYIAFLLGGMAGGFGKVVAGGRRGQVRVLPRGERDVLVGVHRRVPHDGARLDPAAGRVPARDRGQGRRHRGARHAARAGLYFCFAFVPMFIAYSALLIDPRWSRRALLAGDGREIQLILPELILGHTPICSRR
jgi:solute:Na+ symporter, SSS family